MAKTRIRKPLDAKQQGKVDKVTFKYIFDENYNPVYANGAYGGPTTQGELAVNFYIERNPVPLEETHVVGPDGRVGNSVGRQPMLEDGKVTVIRYISTGVILNRDTAKRVHEFLGRHLQNMDAIETARQVIQKSGAKSSVPPASSTAKGAQKKK